MQKDFELEIPQANSVNEKGESNYNYNITNHLCRRRDTSWAHLSTIRKLGINLDRICKCEDGLRKRGEERHGRIKKVMLPSFCLSTFLSKIFSEFASNFNFNIINTFIYQFIALFFTSKIEIIDATNYRIVISPAS